MADNSILNNSYVVGIGGRNLVLNTFGRVYVKVQDKYYELDFKNGFGKDKSSESNIIVVNTKLDLSTLLYPGDGNIILSKDGFIFYTEENEVKEFTINLDSVELINPRVIGTVTIDSGNNSPFVVNSKTLVKNLNVEFLNGYNSNDFAKLNDNETISGQWVFDQNIYFGGKIYGEGAEFDLRTGKLVVKSLIVKDGSNVVGESYFDVDGNNNLYAKEGRGIYSESFISCRGLDPLSFGTFGYATEAFVSQSIAELVGTAPETLDTLEEIANAINGNQGVLEFLTQSITNNTEAIAILNGYFTNGAANYAIQLKNSRYIWGQEFNGTSNVSGHMYNVGNINFSNGQILTPTVSGHLHLNAGFVSDKFISCKGLDASAVQSGGTFDRGVLFDILSGDPQSGESINLGYLDLSEYDIELESINSEITTINGYFTNGAANKVKALLKFGNKSYNGSSEQTITAVDLGALTLHQTIYKLSFVAGSFTADDFTANSVAKTIKIPTTTSHILEGNNLYFTNTRALEAIIGAASTIKSDDLTISRALISNANGKVAVSDITSTELDHLDGVTKNIQAQFTETNTKIDNFIALFNRLFTYEGTEVNPTSIHAKLGLWTDSYLSAGGKNESTGGAEVIINSIADIPDVTIISPTNGQSLVYRDGVWMNEVISGSGTNDWNDIINKPTTLAGYGITDALPKSGGIVNMLTINDESSAQNPLLLFTANNNLKGGIGYYPGYGTYMYNNASGSILRLTDAGELYYQMDNIVLHSGNYSNYALPLSGGTMQGDIVIPMGNYLRVDSAYGAYAMLGHDSSGILVGTPNLPLLLRSNGTSTINGNTLLHSGNYSDYALPLSGGTLTAYDSPLALSSTSARVFQLFKVGTSNKGSIGYANGLMYIGNDTGNYARIGVNDNGIPQYWSDNNASTAQTIIHSGNIGSQVVDGINTHTSSAINAGGDIAKLNSYYKSGIFKISRFNGLGGLGTANSDGLIVNWPLDYAYGQQWYMDDESHTIQTRYVSGGTWSSFKTIAFTDSNVASATRARYIETQAYDGSKWYADEYRLYAKWVNSNILGLEVEGGYPIRVNQATKLATARTIWGQSFDGTGNVSGVLSDVNQVSFDSNKSYGIYRGDWIHANLQRNDLGYYAPKHFFLGNVLIGTATDNGAKLQVEGSISLSNELYCNGWLRSNGDRGWYSETYEGGIHMTDTNFVRTYNGKGFSSDFFNTGWGKEGKLPYTGWNWYRVAVGSTYGVNIILSIGKNFYHIGPDSAVFSISIGYNVSASAITLLSKNQNYLNFSSIRVVTLSESSYAIEVYLYNSVANTDTWRVSGISMGDWVFQAPALSDGGGTVTGQLGMDYSTTLATNGNAVVNGNISAGGDITTTGGRFYDSSDIRLKNIISDLSNLSLDTILSIPRIRYQWKKDNSMTMIGTIAQPLIGKFDELLHKDNEGMYSVDYDSISVIALEGIAKVKSEVDILRERINELEDKVKRLGGTI